MSLSLEEKQIIQAGKYSLIDFSIIADRNYKPNWHHEKIADALEKVERGEIKRLLIQMPPRHGKSQLASINFPAWYLGRNPENEIITSSYSSDLATDFGSKTRDLVSYDVYKEIFEVRLKQDEQNKAKWKTDKGGSYTSVGVGGSLTGRGADILIIDDPLKNREEAESETMRKKVWDWYTSTAYTRLEKNGAVIVIMTRWHLDDLAGRLLDYEDHGGEHWEVISFPAIAEDDEDIRKKGEALWPKKYDLDALMNIKQNIGVYDWNALYQQNPINSETQEFKREWFKYFIDEDIANKDLDVYALVDLAIAEGKQADNTSVQVIGKNRLSPEIYKLEDLSGRLDPAQIIEYLFHLKEKYAFKFRKAGIESVGYQKSLMYFINEEQKRRQTYFDVVELKAVNSKESRIRGLIPMYKNGIIYHRNTDTEYENELLTFPLGRHDDRIDAMAYLQQVLENTKSNQSAKQYTPDWNKLKRR